MRRVKLTIMFLGLNYTLMNNIIYPTLPGIQEQFGLSAAQLSLMASMPALINLVFQPGAGWLSDRVDRKMMVLVGLAAFGLGGGWAGLVLGLMGGYVWILAGRLIMGLGELGAFPQYLALIKELLPASDHRSTMSWMESLASLGGAIGPAIGGFLAAISIKMPFWGCVVFSLVAIVFSMWFIPRSKPKMILSEEIKTRKPFMLKYTNFDPSYLGGFIVLGTLVAIQTFIGTYMLVLFDFSPKQIGFTLALLPLMMAVGALAAVRYSRRGDLNTVGFCISGLIGVIGLLLIAAGGNVWMIFLGLILVGSILGFWLPFFDHDASETGSVQSSGLNLSIFQQAKSFGILVIPLCVGFAIDVSESIRLAYALLAVLFLFVGATLLFLRNKHKSKLNDHHVGWEGGDGYKNI